jgi:PII-like signaling protein
MEMAQRHKEGDFLQNEDDARESVNITDNEIPILIAAVEANERIEHLDLTNNYMLKDPMGTFVRVSFSLSLSLFLLSYLS